MRTTVLALAIVLIAESALSAGAPQQAGTPRTPAPAAAAPTATPAKPVAPVETYSYQPDGRRDPFLSLLATGTDIPNAGKRTDGAGSLSVGEISVRGVLESRGTLVAMIQGPDKKTYIVHQGDKLLDGTIRTITQQGLVVVQEVNDPLSLVKQREVRKLLRSLEEPKE